ncbi:hypothetical protein D3C85_704780 [compost metagenome]
MKKLIYDVGINDLGYTTRKTVSTVVNGKRVTKTTWQCPFYATWLEMLRRGFSLKEKERHSNYKDVTVCEEWLTASNFKRWMEQQDWEGNDLDKDILIEGNKVYSPESCCFVPSYINTLLVTSKAIRGNYPLGVSLLKDCLGKGLSKIFRASIKNKRNDKCTQKNLGHFETIAEAHRAWQKAKYDIFIERLEEYEKESCFNQAVYDKMELRAIKLKLDIALGRETFNI